MDITPLILKMCTYEQGEPQRAHHFLKVYAFARAIGLGEGFAPEVREVLEAAAVVHDIGIKPSLEKYGSAAGPYQELEGPPVARGMLESLGYAPQVVERVCYLVGRHHTYTAIDGPDYQALVEADFLVNMHENSMARSAVEEVRERLFQTGTGRYMLDTLFLS